MANPVSREAQAGYYLTVGIAVSVCLVCGAVAVPVVFV